MIRNAGGRVAEAVINDIAFISYLARTMIPDGPLFEVAVVHHTGCGTGFLADAAFGSAFAARTGQDEAMLAADAVIDPAATVRANVERLLSSPKVPPQISDSGHVYDLQTGLVTTIVEHHSHGSETRWGVPQAGHPVLSVVALGDDSGDAPADASQWTPYALRHVVVHHSSSVSGRLCRSPLSLAVRPSLTHRRKSLVFLLKRS